MARTLLCLMLAAAFFAPAASRHFLAGAQANDPLTNSEADQVRDTAGDLTRRIPLLLQFAQARLTRFEQIRIASPRPPDRDTELYELLRQYREILPEADDAMDDLMAASNPSANADGKVKKRKPPKAFQQAATTLQRLNTDLHRIQTASSPADLGAYHFILDDCLDVTSDSLRTAQGAAAGDSGAPAGGGR